MYLGSHRGRWELQKKWAQETGQKGAGSLGEREVGKQPGGRAGERCRHAPKGEPL